MRSLKLIGAAILVLGLTASTALAHRVASKAQRASILNAAVQQRELTKAQAPCLVVTISTVNSRYAAVSWPQKLSHACERVAANGVLVERETSSGWRFVTVGSSFSCPVRGIPMSVAKDLGICH
jgi:hypothetical protein